MKRFVTTLFYLTAIFLISWLVATLFDTTFSVALLPVALSFVISDVVSLNIRVRELDAIKFRLDMLEKQVEWTKDSLKFESNQRQIGDNLNSIKDKHTDIDLMGIERDIKRLEKINEQS